MDRGLAQPFAARLFDKRTRADGCSVAWCGNVSADIPRFSCPSALYQGSTKEDEMAWTTPVLVEICIGLEINGYMPADGYVPPEF